MVKAPLMSSPFIVDLGFFCIENRVDQATEPKPFTGYREHM